MQVPCDGVRTLILLILGIKGFPGGTVVKNPLPMQEMQEMRVRSLGQEDPLEEKVATHANILA